MDALEQAIGIMGGKRGGQSALANAIGESPQTVNNWLKRGRVPAEYCPAIEKATGGKVKCEELRPDVDWPYLRGTEKAAACHRAVDRLTADRRTHPDPAAPHTRVEDCPPVPQTAELFEMSMDYTIDRRRAKGAA